MTATLTKFKYSAETMDGQPVKGQIEAQSAGAARNELALNGFRVTKIVERKGLQIEVTKQRIPLIQIMHFSRQMSTFIRAGVPMAEALDAIRADCANERFKMLLTDVLERVRGGRSVTEALALHASVFPSYFIAMLGSAELTGRMDDAFAQLHRYIKRDVALSKAVRKALTYPAILLVVALGVVLIIVVFVIPKFADFFKSFDAELPLPTRMLMSTAKFVQSPLGLAVGVALIALVMSVVLAVRTRKGKRSFHKFLLRVPALNTVIIYSSTERFCRVLAVLLEAGVTLTDAMPSAIQCTTNLIFKERLGISVDEILRGDGFAEPIRNADIFPPTMVQMVRVGERTGELPDQLDNVASFYEEELDYAVEKLTTYFEPIVILFIGLVVGFVALAMGSAMYGIYGQVKVQ